MKKKTVAPQKICGNPECGKSVHVRVRECECGYEFPLKNASHNPLSELSEILGELDDDPAKQELLASFGFVLRHLDTVRAAPKTVPVSLAKIANAPEDKQLDLLRSFNFQKRFKSHAKFIGEANLNRLVSLMVSILHKPE